MPIELTLEQRLFAKRVFAAADPRRFLVAKLLGDSPKRASELMGEFVERYPAVASLLEPWSTYMGGTYLGKMCERSLTSVGVAEESLSETIHPIKGLMTVKVWRSTTLATDLSEYNAFIQSIANKLQVSTYSLFSFLSGDTGESPLNKALLILSLAEEARYSAGKEVVVSSLEEKINLSPAKLFNHMKQFEAAGLVLLEPFSPTSEGKIFYKWASNNPPPKLARKISKVAEYLYMAHLHDSDSVVGVDSFCPSLFNKPIYAHVALKRLVKAGYVQEVSVHSLRRVTPTQLCIDVAAQMIEPVVGAIKHDVRSLALVHSEAARFKANEQAELFEMAQLYVVASKTI